MEYPDNCIRGIINEDFIFKGSNNASLTLYEFRPNNERNDGFKESSINWMDEGAIVFTLNQKKQSEELKYKVGYAILAIEELRRLKKKYMNLFDFERDPIPSDENVEENKYHGNLLIEENLFKINKPMANAIRSSLADHSEVHLR